jgi:signal transduction histidine kinase
MRHLYQSIYLAMIASLVAVVVVAGGLWRFGSAQTPVGQGAEFASEFAAAALPDATRPEADQRRAIETLSARLRADITLFDAARQPIAVAGIPAPAPGPRAEKFGMLHDREGAAWSLQLPDGRWLVARLPPRHGNPILGLVVFLAAIAGVIALCAYPLVRGLTRRIERLQRGVETLGAGDLAARVKVEGRDEVAQLARGFNAAAGRIESLVGAQRMLLANTSHELRTPLARIKLGLELLEQTNDPKYRAALRTDLDELDDLIEEILLTSRLGATNELRDVESIDLLALAAEESARHDDVTASGESVQIEGEARLLARLLRNLLENAARHGKPPIEVSVKREEDFAILAVADNGAGVPVAERERVFEAFHQLNGDARGSGLGLDIARRIARLHGGDARVVDAPGGGALFEVRLSMRQHARQGREDHRHRAEEQRRAL